MDLSPDDPTAGTSESEPDDLSLRQRLLWLALAAAFGLCLGALGVIVKGRQPQTPPPPITGVTLRAEALPPLRLGAPLLVQVTLENGSDRILHVHGRFGDPQRWDEFDVTLRSADGQPLVDARADDFDLGGGEPAEVLELDPGLSARWTLDLADYVSVSQPGSYTGVVTLLLFLDDIGVTTPPFPVHIEAP